MAGDLAVSKSIYVCLWLRVVLGGDEGAPSCGRRWEDFGARPTAGELPVAGGQVS